MTTPNVPKSPVLPADPQTEFTAYLYAALPLCVVATAGQHDWLRERMVELVARTDVRRPHWIALDFLDSQSYSTVLWTQIVSAAEAVTISDFASYVRDQLHAGRYLVTFLDLSQIDGMPDIMHEVLIHGYDAVRDEFLLIGYDAEGRFRRMRCDTATLRTAYRRCLTAIGMTELLDQKTGTRTVLNSAPEIGAPTLLLAPTGPIHTFDLKAFRRRLDRYLRSSDEKLVTKISRGYWWLSEPPPRPTCRFTMGLSTYGLLAEHFGTFSPGTPVDGVEFTALHVLTEHKRALLKTIDFLQTSFNPPIDLTPQRAGLAKLLRQIEKSRLQALYSRAGGRRAFDYGRMQAVLYAAEPEERRLVSEVVAAIDGVLDGHDSG